MKFDWFYTKKRTNELRQQAYKQGFFDGGMSAIEASAARAKARLGEKHPITEILQVTIEVIKDVGEKNK